MRNPGRRLPLALLLTLCFLLCSCAGPAPAESSSAPAAPAPASASQPAPRRPDRDIDFASLSAQNNDVVAWLEVPGTVIDYPVVYSNDNTFYLSHNLDREYYVGGSIFLDMANSPTLRDPVIAIYGHFMPDDTLFTQLHLYEDQAYFAENPTVKVFTPVCQLNYTVVAALTVDDRYIFYNTDTAEYVDYTSGEDVQYFLDWLAGTRDFGANLALEDCTVDDSYLVLSTCTQLQTSSGRYIVVARLDEVI